jgi:hypothetical protein
MKLLGPTTRQLDMRTVRPKPKVGDAFYSSKEWLALVARLKVERFGSIAAARCEDQTCEVPGGRGGKVYGDHVVERRDDPSRELDPGNVLFRCPVCHGRKTIEARAARYGVSKRGEK